MRARWPAGMDFSSPYYPWSGPTAIMSPLYPALLSLVFRLFGIYSLTSAFVILSINSLLSAPYLHPGLLQRQVLSRGARRQDRGLGLGLLSLRHLLFRRPRLGVLPDRPALHHLLLHRAANSSIRNPLAWLGWGALYGLTAHSNPSILSTLPFLLGLALYQVRTAGGRWLLNGALTALAAHRRPHPVDRAQLPRPGHPLPRPRQLLAGSL